MSSSTFSNLNVLLANNVVQLVVQLRTLPDSHPCSEGFRLELVVLCIEEAHATHFLNFKESFCLLMWPV